MDTGRFNLKGAFRARLGQLTQNLSFFVIPGNLYLGDSRVTVPAQMKRAGQLTGPATSAKPGTNLNTYFFFFRIQDDTSLLLNKTPFFR
jgi:hypothetical protein